MSKDQVPPGTEASHADQPRRRRHKGRKIIISLLVLGGSLAALVAFAPAILSTQVGRNMIEAVASDRLSGSVELESISLSWFEGQSVEGFTLRSAQGNPVIVIRELSTELTLWGLLVHGDFNLGKTTLRGLDATIDIDEMPEESGKLETSGTTGSASVPEALVDLELSDATITIRVARGDPVVIDDLEVTLTHTSPGGPVEFQFSGRSRQGDLSGSFEGEGELQDLFGADGQVHVETTRARVHVVAKDLPSDGVDGLLGHNGVLAAALGEKIDLTLDATVTPESQDLNVQFLSPNLTAQLRGRVQGEDFDLTQASTVTATLTPELFEKLAAIGVWDSNLRLTAPVPIELTVERLSSPVGGFEPSKVGLQAQVRIGGMKLAGDPRLGELEIRQVLATVATDNLAEAITVTLDAELGQGGLLAEILGPSINLTATSSFTGTDRAEVRIDLESQKLQIEAFTLALSDRLTLQRPAVFRATVSQELLSQLVPADQPITLGQALPVVLRIDSFSTPWPPDQLPFSPEETAIAATMTTGPLHLRGVPQLGDVVAADMELSIRGESLSALQVTGSAALSQAPGGLLHEVCGPRPLEVSFQVSGGLNPGLDPGPMEITLALDSERISARTTLLLTGDLATADLSEPFTAQLTLTPELLERFDLAKPGWPRMAGRTSIGLTVGELHAPLNDFSLDGLRFSASAKLDRLVLEGDENLSGVSLQEVTASLAFDGTNGTATVGLDGNVSMPGWAEPTPLAVGARLTDLLRDGQFQTSSAALEGEIRLEGVPTAFVETLTGQGGRLVPVIGPRVRVEATARMAAGGARGGDVRFQVRSQHLTADGKLEIGEMIELSEPATVRLQLTPDGYSSLMQGGAGGRGQLVLREPMVVEAVVQSLRWPMVGQGSAAVDGTIRVEQIHLRDPGTNRTLALENLMATARSADLGKLLELRISGSILEAGASAVPENLAISVTLADLFSSTGEFNADGFSTTLIAELRQVPVAALDGWLASDGLLLAALGERLDLEATATLENMSGPLAVRIDASHARARVNGFLRDNSIRLNEPLEVELDATPELSQKLLSRLNPFLTGVYKDGPITLVVDHQGLVLPLEGFDIRKIVVREATLDLGQVTIENSILDQGLLGLTRESRGETRSAWFTPAIVSVENGWVTFTRRLDILLNGRYHVATWGTADLVTGTFRQTLAMTGDMLARTFHLENVDPDDMFRIPIRGTAASPEIDFARAAVDLGRLQAQDRGLSEMLEQLDRLPSFARRLLETQVRNLARDLTGALAGRNQGPPPPPAVEPIPWK